MRRDARVILFGEALVDEFPSAPGLPGGAPFNVAWHLRAFGVEPLLISRVGEDPEGEMLRCAAVRRGLDTRGMQTDRDHRTGEAVVEVAEEGSRFEIPPNRAWDFIRADEALRALRGEAPDLLYFGTLAQRGAVSRSALSRLLALDLESRFLDLNLRSPWFDVETVKRSLASADVVKATEEELRIVGDLLGLAEPGPEAGVTEQVEALLRTFRIRNVLVTRGARGAWLLTEGGDQTIVARPPLDDVVDTVGAGDAFSAVLILGSLQGWAESMTLVRADDFARALCRIPGAIPKNDAIYRPFREAWGLDEMRVSA